MQTYSLLTHVMYARHLMVLEEWLDFAFYPPESLVLIISDAPEVEEAVRHFSDERGIPVRIAAKTPIEKIKDGETPLLKRQFEQTPTDFALLVKLDTFPHRDGHQDWLPDAMDQIQEKETLFLTGSTLKYRSDAPTEVPHLNYTARISNNFLLIRPGTWLSIQDEMAEEAWKYGRFDSEGLIELYCTRHDAWGLRRLSTADWRVIHTQVWGERADDVRAAVRAGGPKMQSYLAHYEDDVKHSWQRYFMYPRPPLSKRLRIWIGDARRRVFSKNTPPREKPKDFESN